MLSLLLLGSFLLPTAVQAVAPDELYLQQEEGDSCTLCASTMMIRSCLYRGQAQVWDSVTEASVRRSAWTGAGLRWNWEFDVVNNSLTVVHMAHRGMDAETLRQYLREHPEGIVLYCGGEAPHAVFLTDCEKGIFYCADPAEGYAGTRIPLADSLLGRRHGNQEQILRAVTACWFISQSSVHADMHVSVPDDTESTQRNIPARL